MSTAAWIKVAIHKGATLQELNEQARACGIPSVNLYEMVIQMVMSGQITWKGTVLHNVTT